MPCRRALPFEWGICQRLGDLAFDPLWDEKYRRGAIDLLGQVYRDDEYEGSRISVKGLILEILEQLGGSSHTASVVHGKKNILSMFLLPRGRCRSVTIVIDQLLSLNLSIPLKAAKALLADLQKDGIVKPKVYKGVSSSSFKPRPVQAHMLPIATSSLLDRVQGTWMSRPT